MALGILSLVLLSLLFHGEWKSPCMTGVKKEKKDLIEQKKRWFDFFTKASILKITVSTQSRNFVYMYVNLHMYM